MTGREAVIVSAVRSAVGRGKKGGFAQTRPEDLGAAVLRKRSGAFRGCSLPTSTTSSSAARCRRANKG